MICPSCGKEYSFGDEICSVCGRMLPVSMPQDNQKNKNDSPSASISGTISGTVLLDRYEIQRLIHSGGMGYIYLARDIRLERQVVIKQVKQAIKSDHHLEQLEKEALNMAQLNHPNVAMILDHFTENNYYFLVVEYVLGKTLSEVLDDRGQNLQEVEVVRWMIPVCDALGYMHRHGMIHRDISPDNIMLTPDGHIKLVDFGTLHELSEIAGKKAGKEGKFGFTPPEQWQGNPVAQSDIFAIGATIYYLLTGFLPISDECRMGGKPQPQDYSPVYPPIRAYNSQITVELESLLVSILQPEVTKRYSNINELASSLKVVTPAEGLHVINRGPLIMPRSYPELFLPQTVIDFGYVKPGGRYERQISLVNRAEGILTGQISSDDPAINITPLKIDQHRGEAHYKLTVDTAGMVETFQLLSYLQVQTNAGNASIEVRCTSKIKQDNNRKYLKLIAVGCLLSAVVIVGIVALILNYQASQALLPPVLQISPVTGNIGTTYTVTVQGLRGSGYDYSVIEPDGKIMPQQNVNCSGSNGNFRYVIPTLNSSKLGKYRFVITDSRSQQPCEAVFWLEPLGVKEAKLAFTDNISNNDAGWFTGKITDNTFSCEKNGYLISVPPKNMLFLVDSPIQILQKEFAVEVSITRLSKSGDEISGLFYRKYDDNNYSAFLVNSNNKTYCTLTVADGNWYPRGNPAEGWISSAEISDIVNTMKIVASGSKIYFYVNNKIIKGIDDDSNIAPGSVGIVGGTQSAEDAKFKYTGLKIFSEDTKGIEITAPVFIIVPGGKSDLQITQIWIEDLFIHYKIKNVGGAKTEPSKSYLFVNNFQCATSAVNELVPGQEESLYFAKYSWPFSSGSADRSVNTIKVRVVANYESGGRNFKEIAVDSNGKYNVNSQPIAYSAASTVGKIVFVRGELISRGIFGRLCTINANGTGLRETEISFRRYPMYSPDGNKVVYMESTGADNWDIYVAYNANLGDIKNIRLTSGPAFDGNPSWSSDGKYIAYTSSQGTISGKGAFINCIDADTGDLKYQIGPVNCRAPDVWPYFTLDRQQIVYIMKFGSEWEINRINLNGTNYSRLGRTSSSITGRPVISPDLSKLVFTVGEGDDSEICIIDKDGNNFKQLTKNEYSDYSPNWSQDGKWIVYSHLSFKNPNTSSEFNPEAAGLYIIDCDGNNNVKVNGTTYEDWGPSWK